MTRITGEIVIDAPADVASRARRGSFRNSNGSKPAASS